MIIVLPASAVRFKSQLLLATLSETGPVARHRVLRYQKSYAIR